MILENLSERHSNKSKMGKLYLASSKNPFFQLFDAKLPKWKNTE
jgi:hypothetical protein